MTYPKFEFLLETPNWKLLLICIVNAKGIWKKSTNLQGGGPAPAPPTPPVIRVVLLHIEAADKDLYPDTVSFLSNWYNVFLITENVVLLSHNYKKSKWPDLHPLNFNTYIGSVPSIFVRPMWGFWSSQSE